MSIFEGVFKTGIAVAWLVTLFINFVVEPETVAKFKASFRQIFNQLYRVFLWKSRKTVRRNRSL